MHRVAAADPRGKVHPHEQFDIITGTGTGGISACMLGRLRMPIDKAISEYAKFAKGVFQETKTTGTPMYKTTKLQGALRRMIREVTGDEGEMMREHREHTGCKTVVFAMAQHNLNAGLPTLFRSYTVSTNPDPDCTITEALHATIAHPDLFKSITILDSSIPQSFVGGELGYSNPMAHVLSELNRIYPGRQIASIISIGAGHARTIQVPDPSRWRRTQDVMVMKDMAIDSERVAEEMAARFKGTSGVYFRFNVDQGMQDMKHGSWERLGEAMQHTKAYLQKSDTSQKLDNAVRANIGRCGTISTAHAAGKISHTLQVAGQGIRFKDCPAPTKFYTGRHDEIARLVACITKQHNELRVCVVYGLGGVGKTELVLTVIERTWDNWDHVVYVDASSTEAIEKALDEFGKAKNIGEGYKDVISWLESCTERWLMVFDNADTPSTNIEQYIPARGQRGSIIITTRLPDLANLANGPESVCQLSSISQADGTALLVKIVRSRNRPLSDDDTKTAEELVQDFGCLALAIVHAGAYIAHSPGMTITAYRSLLLTQRQRMLDAYSGLPESAKFDKRGDTVYTTWRICYDQLKPESRNLLSLFAYLHYDGISVKIFKRAAQQMHSKTYPLPLTDLESQAQSHIKQYLSAYIDSNGEWDDAGFTRVTSDLIAYSLVEYDRVNLTYRVHVLVHDWAKTVIHQATELAIECAATLLSLSIDRRNDAESLAYKRQLGLHVTSALRHNPSTGANHSYYFKEVYRATGQWSQMIQLMEQQVVTFQRELGGNDPMTWDTKRDLAYAYSKLGRFDEALYLGTKVVDAYKQLDGEDHPDTLSSMGSLALTYSHMGRYHEAQQLNTQVFDACKRVLGEEHPDTLGSMNDLALTYSHLGRYNEAEQLQVRALDARKRILGEEHPDTLASMSNLALTYSHLGRYHEAEQLNIQVLGACKRLLGEDHPDALSSMSNLAAIYSHMGRLEEAEQLQTQISNVFKRLTGEERPHNLALFSSSSRPHILRNDHGSPRSTIQKKPFTAARPHIDYTSLTFSSLDEGSQSRYLARGSAADIWVVHIQAKQYVCKVLRVSTSNFDDDDEPITTESGHTNSQHSGEEVTWRSFVQAYRCQISKWVAVRHANVVEIYDHHDSLNLHVEYCYHGSVRDYLQARPKGMISKQGIIYGALSGLNYLHTQDSPIIHGSLNAGKIFVDENHQVKIGEFGLAALCYRVAPQVPSVLFTSFSRWMSPELLDMDPEGDTAAEPTVESDIWALACTIHEIIAEELPYSKYAHDIRIQRAILGGEAPGDTLSWSSTNQGLIWGSSWSLQVKLCWSMDPTERPNISDLLSSYE
ncbi:Nephrocystin-3 [Danio rerio] [Rhizoctonia solani]|uniref:Nephrocystin-3 [Danio rerio] n=1 Tax=Rhizoctonia solani TaxID=456999 RepID=A0A0K6GAJ3_9AGAM|nr:Nephrocystin-3 [Danio rerio] [Rhizoctonia solani]